MSSCNQSSAVCVNDGLSKLRHLSDGRSETFANELKETRACELEQPDPREKHPLIYVDGLSTTRTTIPWRIVENMIQASAHAWHLGKPLLRHLTIRWPSGDWSQHQQVQDALAKWLTRKCGGAYYIWAKEGNSGAHSHFLIHLGSGQTGIDCSKVIRKMLKRLNGLRSLPTGMIKCTKPSSGKPAFESVKNRTAYICKGGGPDVCEFLGVNKADWACVPDKQAGVSESLGEAAREREAGCVPSGSRSVTQEMQMAAVSVKLYRENKAAESNPWVK